MVLNLSHETTRSIFVTSKQVYNKYDLVKLETYVAYDSVFFVNEVRNSLFSDVCVDFEHRSIAVVAENSKLRDQFSSYFSNKGISIDAIGLCSYTASTTDKIRKLCYILLATNEFPQGWQLFFETLAKEGKWTKISKYSK